MIVIRIDPSPHFLVKQRLIHSYKIMVKRLHNEKIYVPFRLALFNLISVPDSNIHDGKALDLSGKITSFD